MARTQILKGFVWTDDHVDAAFLMWYGMISYILFHGCQFNVRFQYRKLNCRVSPSIERKALLSGVLMHPLTWMRLSMRDSEATAPIKIHP
jgi:hypothetical protein